MAKPRREHLNSSDIKRTEDYIINSHNSFHFVFTLGFAHEKGLPKYNSISSLQGIHITLDLNVRFDGNKNPYSRYKQILETHIDIEYVGFTDRAFYTKCKHIERK